jgi:hypothetical protein
MSSARPPTEAFAIGTIAEPIATFTQETRLAPLCNHSVANLRSNQRVTLRSRAG